MASRKELKKNINYIAGELFTECLVNSLYVPGTDKQKADELMAEILKMQDEFISRISHSNWDFIVGKLFYTSIGRNASFLIKKEWFFFPLGLIFKAVGGIPVNRGRKSSLVDQMTEKFANSKHFHLAITPEGTRKANPNWKKGFYYIALKAQVPIMLIGIDYPSKTISSTKAVMPTGAIEKDMRGLILNT